MNHYPLFTENLSHVLKFEQQKIPFTHRMFKFKNIPLGCGRFVKNCQNVKCGFRKYYSFTNKDARSNLWCILCTDASSRLADGAECYTRNAKASAKGHKVDAFDTTGAGDAFIGSFLYQLSADGIDAGSLADVSAEKMETYLEFSNRYCAKSVLKAGAIASYPTMDEM